VPSVGSSNAYQQQNASKTNGGVTYNANSELQSSISAKNDIKVSSRSFEMPEDPYISSTQLSYYSIVADCILRGSDSHFEVSNYKKLKLSPPLRAVQY